MMRKLMTCRRSIIAIIGMACLTWLGLHNNIDTSLAIMGIVASVCGANSYQGAAEAKAKAGVDNAG